MTDPRSDGANHALGNEGGQAIASGSELAAEGEMPPAAGSGQDMPRGDMNGAMGNTGAMTGDTGASGEMPAAPAGQDAMDDAILTEMPAGAMTDNGAAAVHGGTEGDMPRGDMNAGSPAGSSGRDSGASGEMPGVKPGAGPGAVASGPDGSITLGGSWKLTFTVDNGA